MKNLKEQYGAIIWLISGAALFLYAGLGLSGTNIPGVEELVLFINNANGPWLYVAALLSILVEGLYIVGNFFPGATLVLILAVVSGLKSFAFFVSIILTIFIGWVIAGAINIYAATVYSKKIMKLPPDTETVVKDRAWTTWFPSYRANYEVAQIAEGGDPLKVFVSSVRVRVVASLAAAVYTLTLSMFVDIESFSNEEGFWSAVMVGLISTAVGVYKIYLNTQTNNHSIQSEY